MHIFFYKIKTNSSFFRFYITKYFHQVRKQILWLLFYNYHLIKKSNWSMVIQKKNYNSKILKLISGAIYIIY